MAVSPLFTAASALDAQQGYIDVVANNLANIDTVGFKAGQASFSDALSETLGAFPSQVQLGMGVQLSAVTPNFSQGGLQSTGVPSDMAINGNGFFVVKNPTSGQISYTRAGNFSVDSSGYLVTAAGDRLQAAAAGAANGGALADVQIPASIAATSGVAVTSFSIDSGGNINVALADNTTQVVGQIGLQNFSNPGALLSIGNNEYQATSASGPMFGTASAPVYQTAGSSGTGTIQAGYLEMSNVDLGQEFSNMIQAQRGLEASTRVITTADEIMQDLLNLKH